MQSGNQINGKVLVCTGYAAIPNHPRSADDYYKLGQKLMECNMPMRMVVGDVRRTWLYDYLMWRPARVTHEVADNPKKNSMAYHAVQHEKIAWMLEIAQQDPHHDVYAWIDYGIFSVPGITVPVIEEFVRKCAAERSIMIPGCWATPPAEIDDSNPCWRFCGGVCIVPAPFLVQFEATFRETAIRQIEATNNVTWEVNTLARIEKEGKLPIWWYQADHNETMFTAYPETHRGTC